MVQVAISKLFGKLQSPQFKAPLSTEAVVACAKRIVMFQESSVFCIRHTATLFAVPMEVRLSWGVL